MKINDREYSETEILAYIKELNETIGQLKEIVKIAMKDLEYAEDCACCLYNDPSALCPGVDDSCGFLWEHAAAAEMLIGGDEK